MTIAQATALLQYDAGTSAKTTWADLGAGSGTFTLALANRLVPGSSIYAVDRDARALAKIPDSHNGVIIRQHPADFVSDALPVPTVDGLLMANALHYVREKSVFLEKVKAHLSPTGCFLVVEYDTDQPNPPWVPYPLSFPSLTSLFRGIGFERVRKVGERRSIYGRANLYAVLIERGS